MICKSNIQRMRISNKFKIMMKFRKMMTEWQSNLAMKFNNNNNLKKKWLRTFKLLRTRSNKKKWNKNRLCKILSNNHKIWVKVKGNQVIIIKRLKLTMRSISLINTSGNKTIKRQKSKLKIKMAILNLNKNN